METPTKNSNKTTGRQTKTRPKQSKGGRNVAAANQADDTSSKVEHGTYEDRNMSHEEMQNLAACLSELSGSMLEGRVAESTYRPSYVEPFLRCQMSSRSCNRTASLI